MNRYENEGRCPACGEYVEDVTACCKPEKMPAHHSGDRIEEAARELEKAFGIGRPVGLSPILQRLYDDGGSYWKHKHDNLERYAVQLREDYAKLRESNTLLNRRATRAEAIVAQRVEEQERKGKSLGRSLANAGYYLLKAENAKLREALTKIAMVCCMNAYAADKNVWCKPEEGRHSIYCAEGMARAALDPSSTGIR